MCLNFIKDKVCYRILDSMKTYLSFQFCVSSSVTSLAVF